MRVLIVKSTSASAPLAEIRTDGRVLDFIVDNTDGALPEATQGSYERLISMVRRSSHMVIEEPQTPVAHLLRYVMNNGDVVEITTEGKTCLLNGKLLGPAFTSSLRKAPLLLETCHNFQTSTFNLTVSERHGVFINVFDRFW